MHPQIATIVQGFERMNARLHALASALPEARWGARNDPDRWSVAECVAHLNLSSLAMIPLVRRAVEEARAMGGPAPGRYRMGVMGRFMYDGAGPLPKLGRLRLGRVKTGAAFVPTGDLPREELIAEFERLQLEQMEIARAADGLPVDRVKVVSPFDARVKYDGYAALALLPRHQERHLIQAEEVWNG